MSEFITEFLIVCQTNVVGKTDNQHKFPMIGTFMPLNGCVFAHKHCYSRAFVHKTFYQFDSCLKAYPNEWRKKTNNNNNSRQTYKKTNKKSN